jgi:hypothetical protein
LEKPLITFETKVWEGDWRIILNTGRLERMIESCDWEFAERVLYINNVKEKPRVLKAA